MPWTDAFHEHERLQKAAVLSATWGHLAPKVREVYTGFVLFTDAVHGGATVIDWELKLADGTELDSSPWFYEDLHDFIYRKIEAKDQPGRVWRFDGTFERLKNGGSRWRGNVRPMRVTYRFHSSVRRQEGR